MSNIEIGDSFFSPTTATIQIGDQIKWTWTGTIPHSTTSDTGLWDSGVHAGGGFSFVEMFSAAGNFPFHCTIHSFMVGSITVQGAANSPPTVAITSPADGAMFNAPATFPLMATASDSDGTVTNVEFFQGSTSLGNVAASPYTLTVTNLAAGDYGFSAVATDNGGSSSTNSITVHVVTPAAIVISAPLFTAPAQFQFSYTASVGRTYVVLRSPDLSSWTPLSTNQAGAAPVVFVDNNAMASTGFYRVQLLP